VVRPNSERIGNPEVAEFPVTVVKRDFWKLAGSFRGPASPRNLHFDLSRQLRSQNVTLRRGRTMDRSDEPLTKWFLRAWCLLLIPWLFLAPLSGMIFITGTGTAAWVFVVCVWTYPVVVSISFLLRRTWPSIAAFLPAINLLLPFAVAAILDVPHVKPR
jgi:hypothetical protein